MIINENNYNKVQINSTLDMDAATGRIIKKSLMLNIRADDVKTACKLYEDLKRKIEGEEEKPEKKVKNNSGKKEKPDKKEQKKGGNICAECGGMLLEKSGISNKNGKSYHFWGCSNFPICGFTKPFLGKDTIPVADQDLVERIPF